MVVTSAAAEWIPVAVLLVVGSVLEVGEPYQRFLHKEELYGYSYPLLPNTVPSFWVLLMTTLIPMAVALAFYSFHRDRRELSRAMLGLWTSLTLTFFITNCVKLMIGRPRPNFVARCWPDGIVQGIPGVPQCTGDAHIVREGMKSFPSGHSSLSFAGLGFLSFYLFARLKPWGDPSRAPWRLFVSIMPMLLAGWVGLTRIRDYWHHPTDVMAGTALGLLVSWVSFEQHRGVLAGSSGRNGSAAAYRTLSSPDMLPSGTRSPANMDDMDRVLDV